MFVGFTMQYEVFVKRNMDVVYTKLKLGHEAPNALEDISHLIFVK